MRRIVVSLCLLLGGLAIFVLGSPYYSIFPTNRNQVYVLALAVFFLGLSVALKRIPSLSSYWQAAYALFMASAALFFMGTGFLNLRGIAADPVQELARDKVSQLLHVVPVLVALILVIRDDLRSIFVARGNLRAGLLFGSGSFLVWAVLAFLLQSGASGFPRLSASTILYLLVWVFANAIMEELWFRAIFLKRYQLLLGRTAAILVTSAVFGLVVFVLGAVGAYAMYKTDSLVGPVLFHAGYDLTIIVPVLNSS